MWREGWGSFTQENVIVPLESLKFVISTDVCFYFRKKEREKKPLKKAGSIRTV